MITFPALPLSFGLGDLAEIWNDQEEVERRRRGGLEMANMIEQVRALQQPGFGPTLPGGAPPEWVAAFTGPIS